MATGNFQDTDALLRILAAYAPAPGRSPGRSAEHVTSPAAASTNMAYDAQYSRSILAGAPSTYGSHGQLTPLPETLPTFGRSVENHNPYNNTSYVNPALSQSISTLYQQLQSASIPQPLSDANVPGQEHLQQLSNPALSSPKLMAESSARSVTPDVSPLPRQEVRQLEPLQPDPRTITDWPTALRYMAKLTVRHPGLAANIAKACHTIARNELDYC